jgi:UDP-N-acetylglucosamine--N-acetylmuramyl-(pentapeptide) pyrophosphoryl-undecaprenol N-acetylglucosamine transferase
MEKHTAIAHSKISNSKPAFLIAGGGTGGHLFPGIAIARELEKRFERTEIIFVVGRRKMEEEILSRYGYRARHIDVEGIKGRGLKRGIAVLAKLPKSMMQSISIIREFSPLLVLGMGSYSAGPVCLAARFMRIPTAIHEQNSYPGLTNRLLVKVVDRVFISFEESRAHLKSRSLYLTGSPVREELIPDHSPGRAESGKFTILVVGGSQGARAINRAFAEALLDMKCKERYPEVIHQTGKVDYYQVVEDYRKKDIKGETVPFIQDMAEAYKRADLVVSRAGALTIFELAAMGKPSILIPYPYAANQHQEINARSLVRAGAAEMIHQRDLTGGGLSRVLMKYMDDSFALEEMGRRASKMGRPDAANVIVDRLLEIIN